MFRGHRDNPAPVLDSGKIKDYVLKRASFCNPLGTVVRRSFVKQVEEIHLKAGEILYHRGDTNRCAFVVASGEIMLFETVDGVRRDCERRGSGSVLGGLSVLTGAARYASAQATTDTTLYKISDRHILEDFERVGPLLRACVETSITFNARLNAPHAPAPHDIPEAITPLRDNQAILDRYKFEIDLENALMNGEFFMVYQPIVRLDTAQIVGFEALMRWNQPDRGAVRPDIFIKAAEDLGIIRNLTDIGTFINTLNGLRSLTKTVGR